MAKVVRFHQTGGPEVLKIEELDVSPPGQNEVQIRIKAIGLNRAEAMFRLCRPGWATRPQGPSQRLGPVSGASKSAILSA
jgi:NADPH:quinone reductase-like Zn-dependent oxidoreductase